VAGTLGLGGAEKQLYYMLKVLTENKVACRVLCLTKGEEYEKRIEKLGVSIIHVGEYSSRLLRLARIIREVYRWRPTILQSSHSYTNLYAFVAGKITKCIAIGAVRTHGLEEFPGFMGKLGLILGRVFIGNSRQALDTLAAAKVKANLILVNNAIDCDLFQPRSCLEQNYDQPIKLLAVGRLVQQKRHDILLKVVAQLRSSGTSFHLVILGEGPLKNTLNCQAKDLGIENFVTFQGSVQNVIPYYHDSDLLLMTSDYEGSPNVILEAMACGLPVVTTKAGGATELVVDNETGFLIECGNILDFVNNVLLLVYDHNLRNKMGRKARARALRSHCLDNLFDSLYEVYLDLVSSRQTRL